MFIFGEIEGAVPTWPLVRLEKGDAEDVKIDNLVKREATKNLEIVLLQIVLTYRSC